MVKELKDIQEKITLFESDSNGREINVYKLFDVVATGESLFYPNVLLKTKKSGDIFNPINETTMSLKNIVKEYVIPKKVPTTKIEEDNVFFFVYNTDNYFHFVYDTLPYLITYLELLKTDNNLKLLMNYPNPNKKEHYKFVIEFLNILGISEDKIKIINNETLYKNVLLSTSYTHDFDSNLPPRAEVYKFLQELAINVKYGYGHVDTPKKIYVSRRAWKHGDFSNIGTNYTTRRKMVNEDALVDFLVANGYTEVFTETMSIKDKINLFANAESVIGAIGGGLCNVLFSNKNCKLIALISPEFLKVNERFLYSLKGVNLELFDDTKHIELSEFKTFMRVKVKNLVGEILEINGDNLTIQYSETTIAGWNNDAIYENKIVKNSDAIKLDDGLNSPWEINLNKFKELL